ncbi:MAG: substrate-binding domain-containing protein [Armatimonadota bacterium]
MRLVRALCAAACVSLAVTGCGKKSGPAEQTSAARGSGERKPVMALVMKTLTNPFFITVSEGALKAQKEVDVDLHILAPPQETDIERQVAMVEDLVTQRVDAILIAPAGSKEIVPALVKAKRDGILVVNVDNRVDPNAAKAAGLELDGYIGADNERGGEMAGEHLVRLLGGKGDVAMLEGIRGVDNAEARRRGFLRAISKAPGIRLVASKTANWSQDEALTVFSDMLQANPRIRGLFCANDMMALGAIAAIDQAGKTGSIYVVGYDNLADAQKAMLDGKLHGTIEQHADLMGYESVKYAASILRGQKPKQKEVLVKLELVTPEKLKAKR